MKKEVQDWLIPGSGLESLLGEYVQIWCLNFIYAGKLTSVNDMEIELSEAQVVFDTGPLRATEFKVARPISGDGVLYVRTSAIESYTRAPQLGGK